MSAGPVLVCFALKHERRYFQPDPAWNCRVVVTGIGRSNARRGLERALDREQPCLVLTCGYAGGLNPALKLGQVVFETQEASEPVAILSAQGAPVDGKRLNDILLDLGAVRGRFHEVAQVVTTAREKHDLWLSTGADAVEMESAEIRRVCQERRIPSAIIRVISDAAAEDLPLDFNRVSGPDQNLSYTKLAVQIVRSPALVGRLLHLQRQLNTAAQNLASVLAGTFARLH